MSNHISKEELVKKLRKQCTEHPPEGVTSAMVQRMSDEDLLDMDYFLHEDVFPGDNGNGGDFLF